VSEQLNYHLDEKGLIMIIVIKLWNIQKLINLLLKNYINEKLIILKKNNSLCLILIKTKNIFHF
jgi:hypothetical protein